jgi:hypothetical protein
MNCVKSAFSACYARDEMIFTLRMDMQLNNLLKNIQQETVRTGSGGQGRMMDGYFIGMRKPPSITNSRNV